MALGFERDNLPSCWQEFDHINRYWDKNTGLPTAKLLPGEYYVTAHNEAITTVLGSCVSACIRDPIVGIGGMNHFMLPIQNAESELSEAGRAERYGNFAMEKMINDILRNGGVRENLEVKIFGGGRVMRGFTDIGKRNIAFVKHYIATEGFRLLAEDLAGGLPRKVLYIPRTGKVLIKKLYNKHNATIEIRDESYFNKISKEEEVGDIELFD